MQIYRVGGSVRDELLGLPVKDRDWVVVGATPEQMSTLGYLPVGKDFPVFLHPQTREEYALARTERKTARGYKGFAIHTSPEVTLEEDLARRDLTINSIAVYDHSALGTGQNRQENDLVDPYGGQRDLQARVLRHVTDAFREDPVRILRVARFAARFSDFRVAPETLQLMREMVQHGEADHLVAERVWQELARGLMEATPSRLFDVLIECGALKVLLPELDRLWGVPQRADYHPEIDTGVHLMMVLDMSARLRAPLPVRFACLVHDLGKGTTPVEMLPRHIGHEERSVRLLKGVCERLRVPVDCRELAEVVAREHGNLHRSGDFGARHWCACWSAATPFANRSASATSCSPANATHAGAWASRMARIRNGRGWPARWPRRSRWPPQTSRSRRWASASAARKSASASTRREAGSPASGP
jgi:tRNA nucleotidyltransferase (CCA-adding enzyme)